jgi:hypothetical protein
LACSVDPKLQTTLLGVFDWALRRLEALSPSDQAPFEDVDGKIQNKAVKPHDGRIDASVSTSDHGSERSGWVHRRVRTLERE